jgi:hypothetical protein
VQAWFLPQAGGEFPEDSITVLPITREKCDGSAAEMMAEHAVPL